MRQLLFRKIFWPAIERGTKRTTVRRWKGARLKAGQRAYAPGIGWLNIEAVEPVELGAFSDDDARADGFESLSEMLAALAAMYPEQEGDGKRWFRVAFHRADPPAKGPGELV